MVLQFINKKLKNSVTPLKFLFKTALYYYVPGGYGYYRRIRKYRDPNFNFNGSTELNTNKTEDSQSRDGFQYRNYDSYEEYIKHQKSKFDMILKEGDSFNNFNVLWYRNFFYRRFRHLENYLPGTARILCAGARQGTEVEVLRDLGFKNAYGIDLNPGPGNKYVQTGDFMHLDNPDSSLDMIYCNAIDHAFNLDNFFAEHARTIKPDGFVLYDISLRQGADFEAVEWDSPEDVFVNLLQYFKRIIKVETEKDYKWILLQGKADCRQKNSTTVSHVKKKPYTK